MKSPSKLLAAMFAALTAIFAAIILSSCSQMGAVTYQGTVKGVPVTIVVGGGK